MRVSELEEEFVGENQGCLTFESIIPLIEKHFNKMEADKIIKEIDQNQDGLISLTEF